MTDRELIELAAKAAGYARMKYLDDTPYVSDDMSGDGFFAWNPLAEDADALRLAVKLRLTVEIFAHVDEVTVKGINPDPERKQGVSWNLSVSDTAKLNGGDLKAATRRAIVRAAAEMGKSK